jgi:uncharacterized protein (UPF0548 family)
VVNEWRFGRGWSPEEIANRLERLDELPVNLRRGQDDPEAGSGWNHYRSEALIAVEPPGPPLPEGPFRRAEVGVANYQFSDPTIVIGHFEPDERLLGRRMLLEMRAIRVLRYLGGVVVAAVRFEEGDGSHTFGFRYDTLDGHLERGSEWFTLTKELETGEVVFRIEATWLPGQFPNWWSRLGFRVLGPGYQRRWHHEAHRRLFRIARGSMSAKAPLDELGIAHAGPTVLFERTPRIRTGPEPRWEEEETIRTS